MDNKIREFELTRGVESSREYYRDLCVWAISTRSLRIHPIVWHTKIVKDHESGFVEILRTSLYKTETKSRP